MNRRTSSYVASSLIITALLLFAFCELGFCRVEKSLFMGRIRDLPDPTQNGVELESLARFAVEEHNKKENSLLKFGRLVKTREQVVAGKMYYFTLEANDAAAGKTKVYEAKVWVKPWMNFKQLQEFKVSDEQNA
ncbi:putative Cystatin domain-containing protein [Helianthus annuus]|uniref:Cysteine proteinase inhibitor n=1 Tax=Helianthus annuus TaxID=4232 RepID=A0A251VM85_HELAN|nr:cysteine proteinase inhibitor A-like [Helianthus annuus]KAF5821154.1 putative Cystatin domain-containing protein [Helianthus annuus]KAJ0626116.1 putative Cystatin domain-containing protein [Helianthus annuus]KAJ0782449.1 putative Cystatin domain-containing protein [Helianthus annuus]KAJ0947055.1 putative Cystatin domain-containing protein [Helianthus annuus]